MRRGTKSNIVNACFIHSIQYCTAYHESTSWSLFVTQRIHGETLLANAIDEERSYRDDDDDNGDDDYYYF